MKKMQKNIEGYNLIGPHLIGELTDNLNDKKSKEKIVLTTKVTYSNLKKLKNFKAVVVMEKLSEIAHETLLLKDLYVPYSHDVGIEIEEFIGQEVKITRKNSKELQKKFALTSSLSGFKYHLKNKTEIVATRGEFILLHILNDHPLKIIETKAGAKKVFDHIFKTKSFAAENFKRVIYRFSDFSAENLRQFKSFYKYEAEEPNPAVGNRGAHRLLNDHKKLFLLELEVINKLIKKYKNIELLVPFVRSTEEGKKIVSEIKKRIKFKVKIGCMVEVPSLLFHGKELSEYFDFFIIGTKDLIQLMSGVSRNNLNIKHDTDKIIIYLLSKYFLSDLHPNKEVYITSRTLYNTLVKKGDNKLFCLND